MNYLSLFQKIAEENAQRIAIVDRSGARSTSYAELSRLGGKVAGKLTALGLTRGDFAVICLGRTMEYWAAYLGILGAGCVAVPTSTEYPKERVDFMRDNCGAKTVITADFFEDIETYAPVCAPADDDAPVLLIYTSGSTGTPKGILHTAGTQAAVTSRLVPVFRKHSDHIQTLALSPFSFVSHALDVLPTFLAAGTLHIFSDEERRSASTIEAYYKAHTIDAAVWTGQMLRVLREKDIETKLVLTGTELISNIYLRDIELLNIYGQSESLCCASIFSIDKPYDSTPLGHGIGDVRLVITDEDGNELPDGQTGEICMVGPYHVSYFKNPELTAKTFVPCEGGNTMIRSGDVGYKNENGDVIYVCRKDWMVKINGQRVETLGVERRLARVPGVRDAAVCAFRDDGGQTYLAGYYEADEVLSDAYLREELQKVLPDYMIPRFLVKIDALPRNMNGKLDRKALAAPDAKSFKAAYVAPESALEQTLATAFEKILACGKVGADDNFFALGGDSIKVLLLLSEVELPALTSEKIFLGKTVRGIAALCAEALDRRIPHLKTLPEVSPLTDAQRGVYLECVNEPESLMYNIPMFCALPEGLDAARFIDAVKTAAGGHKVLQVVMGTPDGVPSMIYRAGDIEVTEKTVDSLAAERKAFVRPFDLEAGPLYRFELCHSPEGDAFLFDVHHIVFDGSSVEALLSQIALAYEKGEKREEELTVFDLSAAETQKEKSAAYADARTFFQGKLEGIDWDSNPVPDVLTEEVSKGAGHVALRSEVKFSARDVTNFVQPLGITENTLFLTAFAYTLAKMNGTLESSFCTVNSGRHDARLSGSVGMFVKTLPMHFTFKEEESIPQLLAEAQNDFFRTMSHDGISFGELAQAYGVNANIVFVYQSELFEGAKLGGGILKAEPIDNPDVQSDINFMMMKSGEGYELLINYRRSLYTEAFMRSFGRLYLLIIREMLRAAKLSALPLTDESLLAPMNAFNETEVPWDGDKTIVDFFRTQAKEQPEATFLVFKDRSYTYREVDDLTDRLAGYLAGKGIGAEGVVGVLLPRSEYLFICSMGILKAGGAYLPLDPSYPPERLNFMLKDSGASLLIAAPELSSLISDDFAGERLPVTEIPTLPALSVSLPKPKPNDLFVLLYTSGSTGTPKGVMFAHSNALVSSKFYAKLFKMDRTSHYATYPSYGFDAHVPDFYSTVLAGAQLHVIAEDIRLDLLAVRDYCNACGITHICMTTQVGRAFALMGGFTTLKYISVGGEKLTPFAPPEGLSFYNLYGPTEGSVLSSGFHLDGRYRDVPIGKVTDNLKAYIVEKSGRRLPIGAAGELWISGPHVTRGYLNRPEKTAEAYGENPFEKVPGYERVYRTGDIVRLLGDGNLQFIGRRDMQVKIRGFRIELTEVEEVIRRFPGIKDATVAAFDDPAGGKYLCAYVVSDAPVNTPELEAFIRAEKPPYMVPAVTMQIDAIPMNQNQKVNKRALPVPTRKLEDLTAPENELQAKIFDVVAEVLGHRDFGIRTNLYQAGLTSIGTVRLNVQLAEAFSVPVKTSDLKTNDTVEKLEAFFRAASGTAEAPSFPKQTYYPLSETQKGIFVECMAKPDTTVYNIPALFRLGSGVDLTKLAAAVKGAIDAHPYIKTLLSTDESGSVRAERRDDAPAVVTLETAAKLPGTEDLRKPFKLLGEPLYRAAIYATQDGNYLFLDLHHIIADGTSEAVLLQEIERAYAGEKLTGETYSGFEAALVESERRADPSYADAEAYWKALLASSDGTALPNKMPEAAGGAGSIRRLGKENTYAVKEYCEAKGLTLNAFFNAAFSLVLGRFTGRDQVAYATIYHGRSDSRFARSVTMMVKTLPVSVNLAGDKAIAEFAQDIGRQLVDSMANDSVSFAELASGYGADADLIFAYQGDDFVFDTLCGEKTELIELPIETAKAKMAINVYAVGGHFEYTAEYDKAMYNRAVADSLIDSLMTAVEEFMAAQSLGDVSLLSASAHELYRRMNDTDTPVEPTFGHQFVERHAKEIPEAVAVIAKGRTLTYRELNEEANRMAHSLASLGVKADSILGLVLDRTAEVLVTELAILKAGGAFLPMLPSYPDERIDFCLVNAESPFVITSEALKAEKPELFDEGKPYRTLTVEELRRNEDGENLNLPVSRENLAYCIYTSGSTGTPKGVMIRHRNFSNYIQICSAGMRCYTDKDADGTCLATSSISFDMSLHETWLPFCRGRAVVMATEEEFHNPLLLRDLMIANRVQTMTCTPSFLSNALTAPGFTAALAELRSIVVAAEAFPAALFESLKKVAPKLQIINGYGPTETTVCSSVKELTGDAHITIGGPNPNFKYYVMDAAGHIQPPYASGELIICGAGVGRGYVKLPEKTAASFFSVDGVPAYHSGDRVCLNEDGEIEFCGRMDNQVKLRGFRVELDEIENVMCEFPAVKQSKVLVRNNGKEDYLAGFFTASETVDTAELTAHLKAKLTYYMVPAVLMQLEQMPLTPNGKIDKKAFPETTGVTRKAGGRRAAKKSLEQRLCEIFASVLGLEEAFADDNFFELGGTSLSASKVTMMLMSEGIDVEYGDIFDNPTPESLAAFIEESKQAAKAKEEPKVNTDAQTREALKWNVVKYTPEVKREPLGNVLLTGAVGFLGIHILRELIASEEGRIYCLVRKGEYDSPASRLRAMLFYYFSESFEEAFEKRISLLDADITDASLDEALADVPFDTVINCAACVKHFADDDSIERINVRGVENLIGICQKRGAKLIQISTVSVPGAHTAETYEKQLKLHENELFVVNNMDNKYVVSKYHAELRMFDAIEAGLRGKVIRVGNLMGRHSDGEFQANMETNMFLSGIRGFATMGKYPISHMTDPMRFSPVDCTARAVVLLAGVNDKFTAFNCDNRYSFDEMKLIDACNRCGITILPADDESYYAEYRQKLGDEKINAKLNGLAAYDRSDIHAVETDNLFTTNVLYRIGFSWPLMDEGYLDRAMESLLTLDYFDLDGEGGIDG